MTTLETWEDFLQQLVKLEHEVLSQLPPEAAKQVLRHTGISKAALYPFEQIVRLNRLTIGWNTTTAN